MASGVDVDSECLNVFQDLKLKKKYAYIVYKLSDDMKQIVIDQAVEKGTYEEFIKSLPKDDCRWAVYDFVYNTSDGERHKILFYSWSPDTARIKSKMVYAASKDALRKKCDGVFTEIQCTDLSEVAFQTVHDKVNRMSA
ncbi:actin depolymerizing protein [Gonapodya prolifera JEL478]|uniref:Cofilin n=1 Tax=Gonapodya prolifera (strain JEL478) TaxID=1344416 RepID=A0A139A8J9_GONPJ|nr:actin depolymerizing protein [Gonapodya prolifera JEL478]|eukprot:KXS13008.1 actin depolymerizing protein [Gonapodya prolifera JEL478]